MKVLIFADGLDRMIVLPILPKIAPKFKGITYFAIFFSEVLTELP